MEAERERPGAPSARAIPSSVAAVADALETEGRPAYLVGGCVRGLLAGHPVADFDLATPLPPEAVLERLPRAIPIGLRHGTVMVPTPDGPVDVTSFRAGPTLADDLAHRDFTINAMALDPRSGEIFDPHDGRRDLAERRLRAVGRAADRFAEDPLRMLRAARLAAALSLDVDPEIPPAMTALAARLRDVAPERVRSELSRLLMAPAVARGLSLLHRSGVEAVLAPGAAADAAVVLPALPADLELRLAGWLRGAAAEAILRRLRFPRRTTARVVRLLSHHPVEANLNPRRDVAVRRLIKRVGAEDLPGLFALREAELSAVASPEAERARLASVRAAVERVQRSGQLALRRFDLAIDGGDVMRILRCGPGRDVGRALRFLTDRVVEDPSQNTPERLRDLLEAWSRTEKIKPGAAR